MKRIYRVRHTLWIQEELYYEEFLKVLAFAKDNTSKFTEDKQTFGEMLQAWIDSGVLPKVVAVICKPYEPTILHRWWNRYWSRGGQLNAENLSNKMNLNQLARVVGDFFFLNSEWMQSLGYLEKTLAFLLTILQTAIRPSTPPIPSNSSTSKAGVTS